MKQATLFSCFSAVILLSCCNQNYLWSMTVSDGYANLSPSKHMRSMTVDDRMRIPPQSPRHEQQSSIDQNSPPRHNKKREQDTFRSPVSTNLFTTKYVQFKKLTGNKTNTGQVIFNENKLLTPRLVRLRQMSTQTDAQSPLTKKQSPNRPIKKPLQREEARTIHQECIHDEEWSQVALLATEQPDGTFNFDQINVDIDISELPRESYIIYQRNELIEPYATIQIKNNETGENQPLIVDNIENMRNGRAPIGPDGQAIQLHHLLQQDPGPVCEITAGLHEREHKDLHASALGGLNDQQRARFDRMRQAYWHYRAAMMPQSAAAQTRIALQMESASEAPADYMMTPPTRAFTQDAAPASSAIPIEDLARRLVHTMRQPQFQSMTPLHDTPPPLPFSFSAQ